MKNIYLTLAAFIAMLGLSGCFDDLFNNDSGYICIAGINCGEVNEDAEYATLEECQACLTNLNLYSCGSDGCYSSVVGSYTSLFECELACGGGGTSGYNCVSGNCQQVSSGASYSTLSACQTACGGGGTSGYNCVSGNCQQVSSGASYSSLSACQSACSGGSSDNAYGVSWQNTSGWWFAVGPIQQTSAGSSTEEEALGYVIPSTMNGNVTYIGTCTNKFKVYDLNADYEGWHLNTMDFVREHNGYTCNWP